MSKVYVVCKTTGYGAYHTPIYLETEYVEAAKMRDELNSLYRKLAMLKHGNLYNSPVASLHEMDLDYYSYPNPRDLSKIYLKEPMILVTDLKKNFRIYSKDEEWLAKDRKEADTDSKYFEIDYKAEVESVKDEIKAN